MGMMMVIMFFAHVPNPYIVSGKRERGPEQGAEEPDYACDDATEPTGMDSIDPPAQFVGTIG